jgi:hypothetical protein
MIIDQRFSEGAPESITRDGLLVVAIGEQGSVIGVDTRVLWKQRNARVNLCTELKSARSI